MHKVKGNHFLFLQWSCIWIDEHRPRSFLPIHDSHKSSSCLSSWSALLCSTNVAILTSQFLWGLWLLGFGKYVSTKHHYRLLIGTACFRFLSGKYVCRFCLLLLEDEMYVLCTWIFYERCQGLLILKSPVLVLIFLFAASLLPGIEQGKFF